MPKVEVIDYGPFEIEVGSPTYERLLTQEKIPPGAEIREIEVEPDEADSRSETAETGGLKALARDQLNDLAKEAGIEEPEKLKNKADVIAAIESASSASETLSD